MPVIAEYVPGYEVVSTQALFVPAKTPREIVGKISADINTVLGEAAIRAKLAEMGYAAAPSSCGGGGESSDNDGPCRVSHRR